MDLSVLLAKAMGIYLLVMGIALLLNAPRLKNIVTEIDASPSLLMISGVLPLIIGTLLVVSHQIWEPDWRSLVTLIGWIAFIKGIIRVCFPAAAIRYDSKLIKKPVIFKVYAIIALVLGVYLCLAGFMS